MTSKQKKDLLAKVAEINGNLSVVQYEVAQHRKTESDHVVDWGLSIFQVLTTGGIASMLSDPSDIIKIAKILRIPFYISADTWEVDGRKDTMNKPYIRLY